MEKGWKRVCLTIGPSHHFAANRTSIRFRYWLIGASSFSNCCFTWRIFLQQGRSINGNTEECRLLVNRRTPMPSPALEVVVDQNTFLCPKGPGRIFNKWDLRSDRIKKNIKIQWQQIKFGLDQLILFSQMRTDEEDQLDFGHRRSASLHVFADGGGHCSTRFLRKQSIKPHIVGTMSETSSKLRHAKDSNDTVNYYV